MRLTFFLLLSSLGIGFVCTAQNHFEKGVVQDSIPVTGTQNESFALYLPHSYQQDTASPIVFIFEPAARSRIGIQPFIEASEKYGYLLVCSNNTKNAPYERNFDIANNLFDHIFSRFAIKEDEMYTSGLSGGSRLACAIASLTDKFTGVVACGAGFPNVHAYTPTTQKYSYVGLVGDRDMNYKEMLKNKDYLKLMRFNSTLITFEGLHEWPPSSQILRAFDWLHLQKLKKSPTENQEEIQALYQSEYGMIESFKTDGHYLFASEQYERLIKSYKEVFSVDSLMGQYRKFLNTKPYKKQFESMNKALSLERKLSDKLVNKVFANFENPDTVNFNWWNKELEKLNSLREKGDAEVKKMVYRLKFDLFVRAYSRKNSLIYTNKPEQAVLVDRFIDLFYPKSE